MRTALAAAAVLFPSLALAQANAAATKAELAAETNARVNADAMEVANRTNADASLQEQINGLQATLASMTARATAAPLRYTVNVSCDGLVQIWDLRTTCSPEPFTIPDGKVFVVEQVFGRIAHTELNAGAGNHARITFGDSDVVNLYCKPLTSTFADCTQTTRLNLSGTVTLTGRGNASATWVYVDVDLAFHGYLGDAPAP
jgi:hypothetical protein